MRTYSYIVATGIKQDFCDSNENVNAAFPM